MNIVVCVKLIPDPEAPVQHYQMAADGRKMETVKGVQPVVSPFDENAIEAALQLKEAHGGKVIALTVGPALSQEALKRALRMGADEAVQVDGEGLPEPAPQVTAYLMAKAIEKIGEYDLVLCGRQAGDWDQGQVGALTAECLNIPCVTIVKHIEVADEGTFRVQRLTEDGYEVMEVPNPSLFTVTNEINLPRLTNVAAVLRASKIKIPVWSKDEIGVDADFMGSLEAVAGMERLYIPEVSMDCQIMSGDTAEDQAANLVNTLREQKII
ncbi:MAG: electron transfer flavoprotein subunit beta/FixA family protein [Deltaproteobacteria bacterium]|nr:electron transfer flavoprotein subunit beta/FixA family protein [Deltaproteobacteria bacterium]